MVVVAIATFFVVATAVGHRRARQACDLVKWFSIAAYFGSTSWACAAQQHPSPAASSLPASVSYNKLLKRTVEIYTSIEYGIFLRFFAASIYLFIYIYLQQCFLYKSLPAFIILRSRRCMPLLPRRLFVFFLFALTLFIVHSSACIQLAAQLQLLLLQITEN